MLHDGEDSQASSPKPRGVRHGNKADIVDVSVAKVVRLVVACRVELASVIRFSLE
jgi:hypothetical protein